MLIHEDIHEQSLTDTHTHTHTHSLSLTHFDTKHIFTHTQSRASAHTTTHTFSLSQLLKYVQIFSHKYKHTPIHNHQDTCIHSQTVNHTLDSQYITHTHSLSLSLTLIMKALVNEQ